MIAPLIAYTIDYSAGYLTADGLPAMYAVLHDALTGRPLPTIEVVFHPGGWIRYRDPAGKPIPARSLTEALSALTITTSRV